MTGKHFEFDAVIGVAKSEVRVAGDEGLLSQKSE